MHHRNGLSWTVKNFGILPKQAEPQRHFKKFNYSCWLRKFSAILCLGHRLTEAKFPSSFKIALVSDFDPVLFSISIRPLKTWKILIKFVVIINPRGIIHLLGDYFRMKIRKMQSSSDKSKCLNLDHYFEEICLNRIIWFQCISLYSVHQKYMVAN